jgi:hypothetical protein
LADKGRGRHPAGGSAADDQNVADGLDPSCVSPSATVLRLLWAVIPRNAPDSKIQRIGQMTNISLIARKASWFNAGFGS